jgi:hypothetical protein
MRVIGKHQRTRPPTRSDEMKNVRIDAFAPAARGQFFGKIMRDGSLAKKGTFHEWQESLVFCLSTLFQRPSRRPTIGLVPKLFSKYRGTSFRENRHESFRLHVTT